MLYTWELVEQKEKREREHKLKERVALQHKLIKKCERYIEDKRMSETQRNVKVECMKYIRCTLDNMHLCTCIIRRTEETARG